MPIEYPDQSYYPSAKCRLVVRFDEFGTNALKGKAPTKTTPKLKGVKDDRTGLQVVADPNAPPGLRRFLLTQGQTPPLPSPGSQQTTSSDNLTHEILGVIPKKASWKQNGIRTADTLSLTLQWLDCPIDPRVLRACAVEFYLGTVTSQEYAEGIAGLTRGDQFGAGTANSKERMNLVPDTYVDSNGNGRTNLRFQGWVDKWKKTVSEEGAILELECVDNTRLLEKQIRPPRVSVGMEKPIDEAIAEYLTHFPQMAGITVEYLPRDVNPSDIPKLKGALSNASFTPNIGPPPSGGGATGGNSETVLDYLTSVVGSIAHSIRIDQSRLIIQRASNLFGTPGNRSEDPFQGRNLPSGRYPVRGLIWGRNVLEYSMERDFAKKEPKNIEVRSYDHERKNVVTARFPVAGDEQLVSSQPGDGKADKNWTVIGVSDGIRNEDVLKQIAEEIYNTMGRQELLVSIKTKNLASFGGGNEDPDLLDMTIGDAFEIREEGDNGEAGEGNLATLESQLRSATLNPQTLIDLGFSADFANAYAIAFTNSGFQREYKLKEMTVDWDVDEGVSFDITGMTYVVARVDQPTTGSSLGKGTGKKQPNLPPLGQVPKGTKTATR